MFAPYHFNHNISYIKGPPWIRDWTSFREDSFYLLPEPPRLARQLRAKHENVEVVIDIDCIEFVRYLCNKQSFNTVPFNHYHDFVS